MSIRERHFLASPLILLYIIAGSDSRQLADVSQGLGLRSSSTRPTCVDGDSHLRCFRSEA